MGHDGGDDAMSMAAMVTAMRNRFFVAIAFAVPIVLWSKIGSDVLGFNAAPPFGLRVDVWQLLLSLPVVFYSSSIFFTGAVRALRARTLDMMVLVAVAVGSGWAYSVVVTLTGGGEAFFEAAAVLASFVLLGHWFEMRARGGANDAIRTLLNLAPPRARATLASTRPDWASGSLKSAREGTSNFCTGAPTAAAVMPVTAAITSNRTGRRMTRLTTRRVMSRPQ